MSSPSAAVEDVRVVVVVALEVRHRARAAVDAHAQDEAHALLGVAHPDHVVRHAGLPPPLGVEDLLEPQVGAVDHRLVGPVARSDRVAARDALHRLGLGVDDVEGAVLDDARRARLGVDEDDRARRVVGDARLDRRLGLGVPAHGEVAADSRHGGVDVRAHDLAPLGQVGLAQQLLVVEPGAVQVDLDVVDQLARHEVQRHQRLAALLARRHATAGEGARRQCLCERAARGGHREDVAGLERRDRRGRDVRPDVAVEDRHDPPHDLALEGRQVGGRLDLRHGRRLLGTRRRGHRDDRGRRRGRLGRSHGRTCRPTDAAPAATAATAARSSARRRMGALPTATRTRASSEDLRRGCRGRTTTRR